MLAVTDLSIRTKLLLSFALVMLVTAALGLTALLRLGDLNDAAADIRENWLPATADLGKLAAATERYRIAEANVVMGGAAALVTSQQRLQVANAARAAAWSAYEPRITPGQERQIADRYLAAAKAYVADGDRLQGLILRGDFAEASRFFSASMRDDFFKLRGILAEGIDFNAREGATAADHGARIYDDTRRLIIGALVLAVLLCIGSGLSLFRGISRPIATLTTAMRRLADRDLALAVPGVERGDEIGRMARAVEVFKESMIKADALAAAEEADGKVKAERAQTLEALVLGFEAKSCGFVERLSSGAATLRGTAQSMSGTASETNRQAGTVAAAAEQASAGVHSVAAAAEQLTSSIHEISRQVAQSAMMSNQASQEAQRTDTIVQALADGAQKIGQVVGFITSIAGQTNLLALNATIEAARAGDAGKGFAVVASEVKGLANQTSRATEEISLQIGAIQSATEDAVAAIRAIVGTIREISAVAISIAAAVEEQGAATTEIARNVQQTAKAARDVTVSIGSVNQAATDTGAAAHDVLVAADDVSRQSEQLTVEVNSFIAGVRAV